MALSERDKIILLIVMVALALYYFTLNKSSTQNKQQSDDEVVYRENMADVEITKSSVPIDLQSNESSYSSSLDPTVDVAKKMTTKNTSMGGFKPSNYNNGNRLQTEGDTLNKFFESPYPNDSDPVNGFSGMVEGEGKFASYKTARSSKKMTEKDKFNPNALLPTEKNKGWFEDPQDVETTTNIKSSRLLNVHRAIPVNTIQSTLKNPSWDVRGTPNNPKYAIGPFNNSSIEPDTNLNNQSLCY